MATTEQWHKLDRFRRSLDRIYAEVAEPHPEIIARLDVIVMETRETLEEAGGIDVRSADEMYGLCSGIAFTVASVTAMAMGQCNEPTCFQSFAGHMDVGTKRIGLVIRELLKPLADKGEIPADYQKKPKPDAD